jgi:hypothetical protein
MEVGNGQPKLSSRKRGNTRPEDEALDTKSTRLGLGAIMNYSMLQ